MKYTSTKRMKTKPMILMAVLFLMGICDGQVTEEQTAFDNEWERSKELTLLYYPDSGRAESKEADFFPLKR